MSAKRFFSLFLFVSIALVFVHCGGDSEDPAPKITPSAQGDDLQKILAKMNADASNFMGSALKALDKGESPDGEMQMLMSLLTQHYNEWRVTSDRLCTGGTAVTSSSPTSAATQNDTEVNSGTNLTRQQCEDKFWHYVIKTQGQRIVGMMSTANPAVQLKVIQSALQIFKNMNITPPQEFLADIKNGISQLQSNGTMSSSMSSDLANGLSQVLGGSSPSFGELPLSGGILGVKASSLNNHPELVQLPLK